MILSSIVMARILFFNRKKKMPTYVESADYEAKRLKEANLPVYRKDFISPWNMISANDDDFLNVYFHGSKNSTKTVIFVHGVNGTNRTVLKVLPYYLSRGYNVISFNNLGTKFTGRNYMGGREHRNLKKVIKNIKEVLPNNEITVHGESMGGATVYNYVSKYGTKGINNIIVDAGYISFPGFAQSHLRRFVPSFVASCELPFIKLFSLILGYPASPFINSKSRRKFKRINHIHSKIDSIVPYSSIEKYKNSVKLYTLDETQGVNHVSGYFDNKKVMYQTLDEILKIKNSPTSFNA